MARTKVAKSDETTVPDASSGPQEPGDAGGGDESFEPVMSRPEKLTKPEPRKPLPNGRRRCKTKAVLRLAKGDVQPGEEVELSAEEFLHFNKVGAVEELL